MTTDRTNPEPSPESLEEMPDKKRIKEQTRAIKYVLKGRGDDDGDDDDDHGRGERRRHDKDDDDDD